MRTPLRQKTQIARAQASSSQTYPAPVGGWNARDALANMKPTDAIALDNWYPSASYVEIRGGYVSHATGMANNGKTLATYNPLNGTNKMFAFTQGGTYDVSSSGAVGASVLVRTNGKHQWVNFGDGTNNYLIACNGVDKPAYYNGTTWIAVDNATSPALTGVTSTSLIAPFVSKGRLFFIQKDTLSVWYLSAGAAGGALTEFDFSGVAKQGGYLMAGATWTVDGGDGPDDRIVLVTSEGEALVYAGTNPSSAADWALVGVYALGKPIGRRCLQKYGADLVVITQNGAFPLAAALQSAAIDYKLALSFKIEKAFTDASRLYAANFGWCAYVFPAQSALIVNVPVAEDGVHYQYVMNTITKAWCRFIGWDAEDFAVFNGKLYFTDGTVVYEAWKGQIDGVSNIVAYGKTAFSPFNKPGLQKQVKMYRPVLSVNGPLSFLTDIDVDFKDTEITGTATYTTTAGALWDVDLWDVGYWATGLETIKEWTSPDEYAGNYIAGKIKIATNALTVRWMASDYIYEFGGPAG